MLCTPCSHFLPFFFPRVLLISCPRFGARGRPPPLHHPHGPYATPFYDEGCSPNPPNTHARKKKNKKNSLMPSQVGKMRFR